MRRAAVQALRTATRRGFVVRRVINQSLRRGAVSTTETASSTLSSVHSGALIARCRSQAVQRHPLQDPVWEKLLRSRLQLGRHQSTQPMRPLESSILYKQFATIIAGLLAAGAYWAYNSDVGSPANLSPIPSGFSASQSSASSSLTALGHSLTAPSEHVAASGVAAAPDAADRVDQTLTTAAPAEATRKALVVENDQFFAGDIAADEPLTKSVDASGRLVVEMLTPEQATEKLRKDEQSYLIGRGKGVVRYDVTQLASNNPIEDDHAEKIIEHVDAGSGVAESGASDWMFWGVFDGHSGWTTSAKLRQVLISFVARELTAVHSEAASGTSPGLPSPEAIDAAIKHGFVRLDHEIVHESVNKLIKNGTKRAAAELLAPALSGSCALLSFYDTRSKLLRVACAGDSRAVLGRRSSKGKWIATALSEDLTGGTPSEEERLRREHPGEEHVVRNGRILGGLEPSRAFGDAIYKWSIETQKAIKNHWLGRSGSPLLRTPPYVTAEPVVTTTKIDPEKGDFVVMATDGLWECLTNEEVVGLVGQWIDHNTGEGASRTSLLSSLFNSGATGLPVENHDGDRDKQWGGDGQRAPIRQQQYHITEGDERFVTEDKNAATHLVRNALGGKDRDMFCALLTLPAPFSRRYRDDLTVEVIFFGDSQKTGDIVQNPEATNMGAGEKAKL